MRTILLQASWDVARVSTLPMFFTIFLKTHETPFVIFLQNIGGKHLIGLWLRHNIQSSLNFMNYGIVLIQNAKFELFYRPLQIKKNNFECPKLSFLVSVLGCIWLFSLFTYQTRDAPKIFPYYLYGSPCILCLLVYFPMEASDVYKEKLAKIRKRVPHKNNKKKPYIKKIVQAVRTS